LAGSVNILSPQTLSMNKNLIAIDYLRAFVTLIVLAVHSSLAYVTFAPSTMDAFTSKPYLWVNYPVVDTQRWIGFDVIFLFSENFVLGLMFLIAGLFIWQAIARKGHKGYLAGRFRRLGIPLVLVVATLSPLAYYPSYAMRDSNPTVQAYFQQWLSLDFWSPGPCWFIVVLLIFDVLVVLLHKFCPWGIEALGRLCSGSARAPARFYFGLIGAAVVVYLALGLSYGPRLWLTTLSYEQLSRALLFLMYFFAGVGIGAWGLGRGLLAPDGQLVRRWPIWLGASAGLFVLYLFCVVQLESQGSSPSLLWLGLRNMAYLLSGGATAFFLMAAFLRFATRRTGILDSLSANAYGMYLIHYAFVTWGQYQMTGTTLAPFEKGLAVFVFTLLGSWGAVSAIRHLPLLGRMLSNRMRPAAAGRV
jgi:hypothetical protein